MWIICFWPVRLAHLLVVAPMQYKEILKESKSKFMMFAVNLKYINLCLSPWIQIITRKWANQTLNSKMNHFEIEGSTDLPSQWIKLNKSGP